LSSLLMMINVLHLTLSHQQSSFPVIGDQGLFSFDRCTYCYRERKIRRNMLSTNPIQGQVRCCQIWGRRRKIEENHMSKPQCLCCLYKFLAELYSMVSIIIQTIFFQFISISSPTVLIKKINKFISETFFFYFIFHTNWATSLC
jgi:hypothetical protein